VPAPAPAAPKSPVAVTPKPEAPAVKPSPKPASPPGGGSPPKATWDAKLGTSIGIFSFAMTAVGAYRDLKALARGEDLTPDGYYDHGLGGRTINDFGKLPEGFSSHCISAPGGYGAGFYEKKNGDIYLDGKLLHIFSGGKLISGGA
jgi:hypothetical protein